MDFKNYYIYEDTRVLGSISKTGVCVSGGGMFMCVFFGCWGVCGGVGVWVCVCGCYKAILPDFSPFSDFDLFKYRPNHKCYGD